MSHISNLCKLLLLCWPLTVLAEEPAVHEPREQEELETLRVLEREHIPSVGPAPRSLEFGFGVAPVDRLALEGNSPLDLLVGAARDVSGEGVGPSARRLAAELSPRLAGVLEQVELDLGKLDEKVEAGGIEYLPFGVDFTDEPAVKHYVGLFTDPGSSTLKVWIQRSGKYQHLIEPILEEEGVPVDLLYLAMIESGYKNRSVSHANAGGMWQFIPSTGYEHGLMIDSYVDERFDPIKATRAAARLLKKNHARFGSWPLAMAAYNGGGGLVSGTIRRFNSNHYFRLVDYGAMYEETRRYVPKIYAAALIAKNPEAFGYEGIQRQEPWRFDEVEVPGGVRLALLADAASVDVHTLQDYNPELLKLETPPDVERYTLRLPEGKAVVFTEHWDRVAERYGAEHETYTVRFGERIDDIAKRFGVPKRVLRNVNNLGSREHPAYGSTVIIPVKGRKPAQEDSEEAEPRVVLVPDAGFDLPDHKRVFYEVNSGDELAWVAEHFGVREMQVALWNDLDPEAKLRKGMTLQLFVEPDFDLSQSKVLFEDAVEAVVVGSSEHEALSGRKKKRKGSVHYKVKRGDSVSKIAARHGVSTRDIIRWNNLDKKATIRTGMRLVIHKDGRKKKKRRKKKRKKKK